MNEILNFATINKNIQNGDIRNLYLFYGLEELLINNTVKNIEEQILNKDFKALNHIKIDGTNFDYNEFINACETMPFMDEKKIVIVSQCTFFKSQKKQGSEEKTNSMIDDISSYLSHLPDTTILIFLAGEEVDKRKKIYGAVKKFGCIAEFSSLGKDELLNWVINTFNEFGKTVSKIDAPFFLELTSGRLEDLKLEISKICSYAGSNKVISKKDIEAVISKSPETNIFKMVDFLSNKKPGNAIAIFNDLLIEGEPIQIILSMIIRQYRLLLYTKLMIPKGYSKSEIVNKLTLNPYVASKIMELSKKYNAEDLELKLKKCLDRDLDIKKGKMDGRLAVESLMVELSR